MSTTGATATARVYVGTYAKYNDGSIKGAWMDLEDFKDKEEFLAACAELHADEASPEFMFQYYEGIPEGMISESSISEEVWSWLELSDDDRELLAVYRAEIDSDADIDQAQEAFMGKYDSEEDWAASYWEDTGLLASIPENLQFYIDYEKYSRDVRLSGDVVFVKHDGGGVWVFSNH